MIRTFAYRTAGVMRSMSQLQIMTRAPQFMAHGLAFYPTIQHLIPDVIGQEWKQQSLI